MRSDWITRLAQQVGPPGLGHHWDVFITFRSGWMLMSVRAPTYTAALVEVADRFLLESGFNVPEGLAVQNGGSSIQVSHAQEITPTELAEWHRLHD